MPFPGPRLVLRADAARQGQAVGRGQVVLGALAGGRPWTPRAPMRQAGLLMPTAWNASSLLATRVTAPGARPAMLRAVSSRLLATVTSTMAASGTPVITVAVTVSRMIITFTFPVRVATSFGRAVRLSRRLALLSNRCPH